MFQEGNKNWNEMCFKLSSKVGMEMFLFPGFKEKKFNVCLKVTEVWRLKAFAEQALFSFIRSRLSLKTFYVELTIPYRLYSSGTRSSVQPVANRKERHSGAQ